MIQEKNTGRTVYYSLRPVHEVHINVSTVELRERFLEGFEDTVVGRVPIYATLLSMGHTLLATGEAKSDKRITRCKQV